MGLPWTNKDKRPPLPQFIGEKVSTSVSGSVNFGQETFLEAAKRVGTLCWRKISKPSTGTLTDGFGHDASLSHTNASVGNRNTRDDIIKEDLDSDWTVDEIFVQNDPGLDADSSSIRLTNSVLLSDQQKDVVVTHTQSVRSGLAGHIFSVTNWTKTSIGSFFDQSFSEQDKELEYRKQMWYAQKLWAVTAAAFLIVNMALYLALNHDSNKSSMFNKMVYWVGFPAVTGPIMPMVIFDLPRKSPFLFQLWFTTAVWYCGITEIINMKVCNFFIEGTTACHGKDFLAMMSYNMGLPAVMMFVVTTRAHNAFYQLVSIVLVGVLLLPDQHVFARNLASMILFAMFIQVISYQTEKNSRRVFTLTRNLKFERRTSDKARFVASKEQAAKEKLASYIFHEVRVPLNVAQLAFENLRMFHSVENHAEMYAIDTALNLMHKVLNDALDLSKMDSGSFENVNRPFPLHTTIQSAMDPIVTVSTSKGIEVECRLDPRVDKVAPHQGTDGLWVIGDELRLRQILTNLASNAVKFCPEMSGRITLRTTLLHPLFARPDIDSPAEETSEWLEVTAKNEFRQAIDRKFILRIESAHSSIPNLVTPTDVRENRLFQPFVQTAAGKRSRKGTGLGLAIVRQIVSLTGGQLGLKCRRGEGATFWIEMPYKIASKSEIEEALRDSVRQPGFISSQNRAAVMNLSLPEKELPLFSMLPDTPDLIAMRTAQPMHDYFPSTPRLPDMRLTQESTTLQMHLTAPATLVKMESDDTQLSASTAQALAENPVPPSIPQPRPPPLATPPTDSPHELRVLVVDDDFLTRTIMTRQLQKAHACLVDVAEDGEHFLRIINDPARPTYDLITLDNHMPCMTGEEAIREFRGMGREEYVVGCTGNGLVSDTRRFLEAGVDEILVKPLGMVKLNSILSEARDRRDRRRLSNECKCKDHSSDS